VVGTSRGRRGWLGTIFGELWDSPDCVAALSRRKWRGGGGQSVGVGGLAVVAMVAAKADELVDDRKQK
jgi:hypothetical protein